MNAGDAIKHRPGKPADRFLLALDHKPAGAICESVLSDFKGLRRHFGSRSGGTETQEDEGGHFVLASTRPRQRKTKRTFRHAKRNETHGLPQVIEIVMGGESVISRNRVFSMGYQPFRFAVFHFAGRASVDPPPSAVMAGLVPAIHATPAPPSAIGTENHSYSVAYIDGTVFSWMAGSSPARTTEADFPISKPTRIAIKAVLDFLKNNTASRRLWQEIVGFS